MARLSEVVWYRRVSLGFVVERTLIIVLGDHLINDRLSFVGFVGDALLAAVERRRHVSKQAEIETYDPPRGVYNFRHTLLIFTSNSLSLLYPRKNMSLSQIARKQGMFGTKQCPRFIMAVGRGLGFYVPLLTGVLLWGDTAAHARPTGREVCIFSNGSALDGSLDSIRLIRTGSVHAISVDGMVCFTWV